MIVAVSMNYKNFAELFLDEIKQFLSNFAGDYKNLERYHYQHFEYLNGVSKNKK